MEYTQTSNNHLTLVYVILKCIVIVLLLKGNNDFFLSSVFVVLYVLYVLQVYCMHILCTIKESKGYI